METNWENSYYVNNQDVLSLLNTRSNAKCKSEKNNVDSLLIKNLLYLVYTRVRGYKDHYYYEDAMQEGIMGLMRAFNEFDSAKGPNFFLVAKWYINTYVRNFISRVCKKHENVVNVMKQVY
jgi:DNA-directed RNA polymerase specialized sigma subunit